MGKTLILSPHCDDIELAMGGTLFYLEDVVYVCFSNLETNNEFPAQDKVIYINLDYPNKEFPNNYNSILCLLDELKKKYKPEIVYCPSTFDIHQDHKTICECAMRVFKNSTILGYEEPWNNYCEKLNYFHRLEKRDIDRKCRLLQNYKSQKNKPYFNEKFIYGLAKVRGVQCGADFAETFEVIRWVE